MPDETGLIRTRPRIGLALGAGVARGWAHIGVLRALKRLGIEPDIVTGTSVGALVGGAYLAGQLDTLEDWARNLSRMKIVSYLDLRVRSGGLISGGRLMAEMKKHMGDKRIEDLPMPFAAIATDLVTGHEVWLRTGRWPNCCGRRSRCPASSRPSASTSAGWSMARSSIPSPFPRAARWVLKW